VDSQRSPEYANFLAGGQIPQAGAAFHAPGDQPPPVARQGEGADIEGMPQLGDQARRNLGPEVDWSEVRRDLTFRALFFLPRPRVSLVRLFLVSWGDLLFLCLGFPLLCARSLSDLGGAPRREGMVGFARPVNKCNQGPGNESQHDQTTAHESQ